MTVLEQILGTVRDLLPETIEALKRDPAVQVRAIEERTTRARIRADEDKHKRAMGAGIVSAIDQLNTLMEVLDMVPQTVDSKEMRDMWVVGWQNSVKRIRERLQAMISKSGSVTI